jgi:DNA-binding protein YbaB
MKSFDTDLKKYAEKINLKVSERQELRERILSYMEYHPLPKSAQVESLTTEYIPSESFIRIYVTPRTLRFAGATLALVFIVMPFVAERSVPGDVLYLVKTGVNETIQGTLANSPYQKIEFETKLMERRISEARILASEGKLTEETKTQLAETVKEHTQAVRDELVELRTQDANGAAIAEIVFNSSLEVQSTVLGANTEGGNSENDSLIDTILTVVNDARVEVATNQENNTPSFESLVAHVELQTTRAYELFATIQLTATEEEIQDINRRLSDIERLFGEAKKVHETEPEIAVTDLTTVLGLAQKLIVFMTNIDVREAVTLESLVPVVLSDDERIASVEGEMRSLEVRGRTITERVATLTDAALTEKVTEGNTLVTEHILKATIALEGGDIDTAELAVKEALALMTDLETLTTPVVVIPEPETPTEVPTSTSTPIEATTTPDTTL